MNPAAIAHAIARNDPACLTAALAQAPAGWECATNRGHTCWARVLTDKRRTHLVGVLRATGMNLPPTVRQGKFVGPPLALAIRHGRLDLIEPLLEMGADPNAPIQGMSLLAWAVLRLARPGLRAPREVLLAHLPPAPSHLALSHALLWSKSDFDALATTTATLLAAGARPCPSAVANWVVLGTSRPGESWLQWAQEAAAGVDPAWETPDRALGASMAAYLLHPAPLATRWLEAALAAHAPTPAWLTHFTRLAPLGHARSAMPVDALVDTLLARWPRLRAQDWSESHLRTWASAWGSSVVQGPARVALVRWAVSNDMPVHALAWAPRSVVASLSASSSLWAPDPGHALEIIDLVLGHLPKGLDTLASPTPGAPPTSALQEMSRHSFWRKLGPQVRAMDAAIRARRLSTALAPSAPGNRIARL